MMFSQTNDPVLVQPPAPVHQGVLRGVVPKQAESRVGYTPEKKILQAELSSKIKQIFGTKHLLSIYGIIVDINIQSIIV